MIKIPESAVLNGRTFKLHDRVKCYFAKDPRSGKWFSGGVVCFVPTRCNHPKSLYDVAKSSNMLEVIVSENENGWIVYDDYRCILMHVKTDEMVDDREERLFNGFGICCHEYGPVIFDFEEEYDTSLKISEDKEIGELPF